MKKRKSRFAQVSIFVVIAIVIIGGVAISFFVLNKPSNSNIKFSSDAEIQAQFENLRSSIEDCMKDSSQEALYIIGDQGGYFDKPKNYLEFGLDFIPYYYYEGEIIVPTKTQIQAQLGKAVDDQLVKCIKLIDAKGFSLEYGSSSTKAIIGEKKIDFKIDFPVVISQSDKRVVFETKNVPVSINSELNAIIGISDYYAKSHKTDPAMFCISCISDMADKNDLYVNVIGLNNESSVVIVSENHTGQDAYSFEFANKYKGDEQSPVVKDIVPTAP